MAWFIFAKLFDFLDKYNTNDNNNIEGLTFLARVALLAVLITGFWKPVPYIYNASDKWDDYGLDD